MTISITSTSVSSDTQSTLERLWSCEPECELPNVYAIIDCAQNSALYNPMHNSGLKYESLFAEAGDFELIRVSPHLVRLDPENKFTYALLELGWGQKGYFIAITDNTVCFSKVRYSLKKMTYIKNPDNKKLLFRYFDHRVMPQFLASANAEEIALMFGPIDKFIIESPDARNLRHYTPSAVVKKVTAFELKALLGADRILNMRPAQWQFFTQKTEKIFERQAVLHLKKHFPNECQLLDGTSLLKLIKNAINRCEAYDIKTQQDILRYLNYMFQLDLDFDQTDKYPWARHILNQTALNSHFRMDKLNECADIVLAKQNKRSLAGETVHG